MSEEKKNSDLIAQYGIIQETINATSQLIIQFLGFTIAAIIGLVIVSFNVKNIYPLFGILGIILVSAFFISEQTKLIIDTETYLVVFIESNLPEFKWKQRLSRRDETSQQKQFKIFPRLFILSDFTIFTYIAAIIAIEALSFFIQES